MRRWASVGVTVQDRIRWEEFSRDVLGFLTFLSADGAVTSCRIDEYHHRIGLTDGVEPGLHYDAFDVGNAAALDEWREMLASKGVATAPVAAAQCAQRRLRGAIELHDPDGHRIALGYGFEMAQEPVRYTRPLSALRLGLVLLTVPPDDPDGFAKGVRSFLEGFVRA